MPIWTPWRSRPGARRPAARCSTRAGLRPKAALPELRTPPTRENRQVRLDIG